MYTLIVVDMQAKFANSLEPRVIRGVAREIIRAKKNKAAVVFVEYDWYGPTQEVLTNLCKDYEDTYKVNKPHNDGSREVFDLIDKIGLDKEVRVCGVNTSYCVYETVAGLTMMLPLVTVVADACNCHPTTHPKALQRLADMPKVKVVRNFTKPTGSLTDAYAPEIPW